MTNLPRFTLSHDSRNDDWKLKNDMTGQTVRRFDTKADATSGGTLEAAVGSNGGSVRIHNMNGIIQEERTYPGSRDPKKSPG